MTAIIDTIPMAPPTGWMHTSDDATIDRILGEWASLACRTRGREEDGDVRLLHRVGALCAAKTIADATDAAYGICRLAGEMEGDMCPNVHVGRDDAGIELMWDGTWTKGRCVVLTLRFADGDARWLNVRWHTGTGNPSTFLGWIGAILADDPDIDTGSEWAETV